MFDLTYSLGGFKRSSAQSRRKASGGVGGLWGEFGTAEILFRLPCIINRGSAHHERGSIF